MAVGMADYSSVIRPKYGATAKVEGAQVVPADLTTTIATVGGRGMLYGGFIQVLHASTQRLSVPIIYVDGVHIVATAFYYLDKMGTKEPRAYPIVILAYDDVNFIYSVGISYGLTFETEVELKYNENHSTTPTVVWSLVYALI